MVYSYSFSMVRNTACIVEIPVLFKLMASCLWWSLLFLLPLLLCAYLGCVQRYECPLVPAPCSDDGDTDAEHQGGVVAADELH